LEIYKIEPPHELTSKKVMSQTLSGAKWIEEGKQMLTLSGGVPQSFTESGQATCYTFSVLHGVQPGRDQAEFDPAWRAIRDGYYDGNLNNRNSYAICKMKTLGSQDLLHTPRGWCRRNYST
jgi:hypothetical protein